MRITATVTVELPMSEKTQTAIASVKAEHEAAQLQCPEDERIGFSAHIVHEIGAVARELDARASEGRAALASAMKGWRLSAHDLHMFVGGARGWAVMYQQRFEK